MKKLAKNVGLNVFQSLFTGGLILLATGDVKLATAGSLIVSALLPDRK